MKTLIFTMLMLFPALAFAQNSVEAKIARFEKPKQYQLDYDKFKDRTQITSPRFTTRKIGEKKLNPYAGVTLYMTFPGHEITDVEFWLAVDTIGYGDWKWTGLDQVIVLTDGRRTVLSVDDRDSGAHAGRSGVSTTESIYLQVPVDKLKWILEAKEVEFQAGRIEFALDDKSIAVFRNMLSLTDK